MFLLITFILLFNFCLSRRYLGNYVDYFDKYFRLKFRLCYNILLMPRKSRINMLQSIKNKSSTKEVTAQFEEIVDIPYETLKSVILDIWKLDK